MDLTPGQYHLARYEDMTQERRPVEEWWQQISEYVLPRKSYITEQEDFVDDSRYRRLYDTTAIDACQTLANGHSSYITPGDQRWFTWTSPDHIRTDEGDAWYRHCSSIAAQHLTVGNFYTVLDECYLDRSGFGLGNFSLFPGKAHALTAQVHAINTYCIEESAEGGVDTVYFTMEKGIRQLRDLFGDNIEKSEHLRESWEALKEKGTNKKHKILHCVYPRRQEDRTLKSQEGKDLPIASLYICCEGKEVIAEGGFAEMPYCVTRFLKHTGRGNQYGFSPAWRAMPAVTQLNFLQKAMDMVAEKAAVPPVLIPDYLEGDVDLRAGGMTMFKANRVMGAYALPQEWGNQGRYDIGVDRVNQKKDEVNRAFHVDLFRMFAELERPQMTATEVAERAGEKMVQFSPSFTRFMSDFTVAMNRVFGILLRGGYFPPPPEDVIEVNPYRGTYNIPEPKVMYQSKIALALQQTENTGIDRLLQRLTFFAEAGMTDVFDNINLDRMTRQLGRNDGVPEEVFRAPEEIMAIRQQRAEQQQAQMEMEQAQMAAKAGKDAADAAGALSTT